MNQNLASLLVLLCILATWAWVWRTIATRRTARGKSRFMAHLLGALAGCGAAFGALCLNGAVLMPRAGDEPPVAMGVIGALVLGIYLGVLRPFKKQAPQNKKAAPAMLVAAALGLKSGASPVAGQPRTSLGNSLRAWWRQQKSKQEESMQQADRRRTAREKALGMPLGTFFSARMEAHLTLWFCMLFLIVWACLFAAQPPEGGLERLGMSFFIACLSVIVLCALSCIIFIPAILLFLALLPFACISIVAEAWWRIHYKRPYIASRLPVTSHYSHKDFAKVPNTLVTGHDNIAPATPPKTTGSWIVPLLIGLWIGNVWGKDD